MPTLALVRPLEDDWRDALDAVARARAWPSSGDVAALAARVAALSAAYNDPARARAAVREAGPARLGFSFARDVPKGAAAVRELVAAGALPQDGTLRVLDVGAGLGATTWGVVRALRAGGFRGGVDATWVDSDAAALDVASAIVRARAGREGPIELHVRTRTGTIASVGGRFDLVLAGQVLSELDVASPEDVRVARHVDLLRSLLDDRVDDRGALVVIEPALRDRSRHLHRVRDGLVATGATVFAPCLHHAGCPALAREGDWCHEDLDVELPGWLAPVARAAGLRREGLTFSYLVLTRGGLRLADALQGGRPANAGAVARLRVVSEGIRSKGKREAFVCGEVAGVGGPVAARARLMRLDRDRSAGNEAWDELGRGDIILVAPAPELERPRIGPGTTVEKAIVAGSPGCDAESR